MMNSVGVEVSTVLVVTSAPQSWRSTRRTVRVSPRTEFTSFQRKLYHSSVPRRMRLPVSSMRKAPWSLAISREEMFVARSRVTRQWWRPGWVSVTARGVAASGSPNSRSRASSGRRARRGTVRVLTPVDSETVAASGEGQARGQ